MLNSPFGLAETAVLSAAGYLVAELYEAGSKCPRSATLATIKSDKSERQQMERTHSFAKNLTKWLLGNLEFRNQTVRERSNSSPWTLSNQMAGFRKRNYGREWPKLGRKLPASLRIHVRSRTPSGITSPPPHLLEKRQQLANFPRCSAGQPETIPSLI
jgi:hypothetical protein